MKQSSDDGHTSILSGTLEKRKTKNNDNDVTLYLALDSRVISIQNNKVSSVAADAHLAVRKITDENKVFLAAISSKESNSENSQHVAYVSNLKAVKRKGKTVIKMNASSNQFDTFGKYAKNSTSLGDIDEGNTKITILSMSPDSYADWVLNSVRIRYFWIYPVIWQNLPGSLPISSGGRVNWQFLYLSNQSIAALTHENKYFFIGRNSNGNVIEVASFTRDELRSVLSFVPNQFGINNFESWKRSYGYLFHNFN